MFITQFVYPFTIEVHLVCSLMVCLSNVIKILTDLEFSLTFCILKYYHPTLLHEMAKGLTISCNFLKLINYTFNYFFILPVI